MTELKPVKPAHYDEILALIEKRTKLNPIKSSDLEMRFGVSGGRIRDAIHYARFTDLKPIALTSDGYYLARSWMEWKDTAEHYKSRAFAMLSRFKIIDGMFSKQEGLFPDVQA